MEEITEFVSLVEHEDYEILTTFPHIIRRKDNHHVCSESMDHGGYIKVKLNGKTYLKHRIIGLQFIPNDDQNLKKDIDHINHIRDDNRIENLRWCSHLENSLNKSSSKGVQYEFIDNIPDDAIKILHYDTRTEHHEFDEDRYYYYHDESNKDIFYCKVTDELYRILYINITKNNQRSVSLMDTNHKNVNMHINKFKKQYTLYPNIDIDTFMQNNFQDIKRVSLKDVQQKYVQEFGQKLTYMDLIEKLKQTGKYKITHVHGLYYVNRT